MGTRKSGACKAEQPDRKVEPAVGKKLDLDPDLDIDLDTEPDFDTDENLGIDLDLDDDSDADLEIDDTAESVKASSNVGETSVEINVEELIAELEADCDTPHPSKEQSSRKRLEVILEERRVAHELEEMDEFDSIDGD